MPLVKRSHKVLTGVLLVVAALGAAPAQEGADGRAQAGYWERSSAHARMPSTLYASAPNRTTPPHSFPLDVGTKRALERSVARAPAMASAKSHGGETHLVPLFAPTSDRRRKGFVRVINHASEAGEVRIDAFDDAGSQRGPVTLSIGAGEAAHFNSDDLLGNADKGLDGATGSPGDGHWRLELTSALDLEVLANMRTEDGFLTSMHDLVPYTEKGHRVAIFNPGKNTGQVSRRRLINPGAEAAEVTIKGIDDDGESPASAVVLSVPARASRPVTAEELESGEGEGLSGNFGAGAGKWRLVVTADRAIEVMSLLSSPTGHLTNLSTVPDSAESDEAGAETTHTVPLFSSASRLTHEGVQGFVRVINHASEAGEVRIDAVDDAGSQGRPVTMSIGAGEAAHFNSGDLEIGNADKGLSGGIGAGAEDWRLALTSALDLEVLAYIRTADGFLTSMHDLVRHTEKGHRVAIFNPGKNTNQVSRLRLINPGAEAAEVTIEGIDDDGESPASAVVLSVPARGSRTVTAEELESGEGEGLSGAFGAGAGKWQLVVTADRAIEAMSLLSSSTGHLTNLSSAPGGMAPETAAEVFGKHISGPIVQSRCIKCHVEGGLSGHTRLVFVPSTSEEHEKLNLETFERFLAEVEGERV